MKDLRPIRRPFDRYLHFSMLVDYLEDQIAEAVANLPTGELLGDRSCLITRLGSRHFIEAPVISWDAAAEQVCEHLGGFQWRCVLIAPMADPSCVMWSVEWPRSSDSLDLEYEADLDEGFLLVIETIWAPSEIAASEIFEAHLHKFRSNVASAAMEFERFNAAMPYLITKYVEARVDGHLNGDDCERREMLHPCESCPADPFPAAGSDKVVVIEEIDPLTRKLRRRYFHRAHAPKAN